MRCPAGRGACLDLHDVTTRHACNRKIQLDWCRRPHNMQTNDLHTNCHWHVQTMQWRSQGQNVKEKAWTFKAEATTISPKAKAFVHMAREEIKIQPDRIGSKLNFDCFYLDIHLLILITYTGWPLSRQCEIPWHFPDSSRHSSTTLGMSSVTHIMPVLVLLSVVGVRMQQYMIRNYILII